MTVITIIASALSAGLGLLLGIWLDPLKALRLAQSRILVDLHEKRIQACQEMFEAAGMMCSPTYLAAGPMISVDDLMQFVKYVSSTLNRQGVFLDPCSRACAIYLRELGGSVLREVQTRNMAGIDWTDTRKLWVAKSLLRSVLNAVVHTDIPHQSMIRDEKWVRSDMNLHAFREDLLGNLKLLDRSRSAALRDTAANLQLIEEVIADLNSYLKPESNRELSSYLLDNGVGRESTTTRAFDENRQSGLLR